MEQLQYRIQTSLMDEPTAWRDISPEDLSPSMRWDYRRDGIKIELFEIRVKPEFVPGWYQYVGPESDPRNSIHYFEHLQDSGYRDGDLFEQTYRRYEVTPAE